MPPSSRARRGVRALVATSGLALVATSATLISSPPAQAAEPVDIQILGTNDFHGRLVPDRVVGAAKYGGAVEALRAENPNTLFVGAGDLIGATTFESFIAQDKPTIDVFNELGLSVSAVGNHELDAGYSDLVDRVMAPESETNPYGGAEWEYIAANIDEPGDADAIAPSWTTDIAGVTVGFVGAITEDLPQLVRAEGIEGLEVTDIVDATNEEAAELKEAGADMVVMLVHEGAPQSDCATMDDDPTSSFGEIVTGVGGDVDAIISGHTHRSYSCSFPVADWASDDTRVVKERPVVSAGEYGSFLDKLVFSVDPESGVVQAVTHETIDIAAAGYPTDPEVQAIVDAAIAAAEGPGSEELGEIGNAFKRAANVAGSENRGGESTLGNFVAEVQRWATGADLGLMNPGGLRADMVGNAEGGYPAPVTYRQAAVVQPFANTLVTIELTGAELRQILEEQVQPEGSSRPFFRLGVSEGFTYTYDPSAEVGKRISTMWLDGKKVTGKQVLTVSANSFLASGTGDNFFGFAAGSNKKDTGKTDLQAMVDYLDQFGTDGAVPVDWTQRAVGLDWKTDTIVAPGARGLRVKVSSWSFTAAGDLQDSKIRVKLGKRTLGLFPVDNTLPAVEDPLSSFDETGTASINVKVPLPKKVKPGVRTVTLVGNKTGTTVEIPVRVKRKK